MNEYCVMASVSNFSLRLTIHCVNSSWWRNTACLALLGMSSWTSNSAVELNFADGASTSEPDPSEMLFDRHHRSPVRNSFLRFGLEIPTLTVGDDSGFPDWDITIRPVASWLRTHYRSGSGSLGAVYGASIVGNFQRINIDPDVNNTSLWYRYAYLSFRYNVGASWQINPSLRWENLIFAGGGVSTLGLKANFFANNSDTTLSRIDDEDFGGVVSTALTAKSFGNSARVSGSVVGYSSLLHLVRIISTCPTKNSTISTRATSTP